MVNSYGVGLFIFYSPRFRKLHWGLCTGYTVGVISIITQVINLL